MFGFATQFFQCPTCEQTGKCSSLKAESFGKYTHQIHWTAADVQLVSSTVFSNELRTRQILTVAYKSCYLNNHFYVVKSVISTIPLFCWAPCSLDLRKVKERQQYNKQASWFSQLLRHSAGKRSGLILQLPHPHEGQQNRNDWLIHRRNIYYKKQKSFSCSWKENKNVLYECDQWEKPA